jgi:anti-sigma factor RsiW
MSGPFGTGGLGDERFGGPRFGAAQGAGHLGDALSALLDGELASGPLEAARGHLAACPDCVAELRAVSQARTWVRALPPVDPPFGFYERVLRHDTGARIVRSPAPLRRRAGLAVVGLAATAATVLGVGSPQQSPAVPSVPHLVQAHAASTTVSFDLVSKLSPMAVPVSFGH